MQLDIALSDHNYSKDTLTELGKVIKMIHGVSDSPQECFWAFLQYVTIHHSELLAIELPEGMAEPVARILAAIQLPPITLQPSWRAKPEDEQNS